MLVLSSRKMTAFELVAVGGERLYSLEEGIEQFLPDNRRAVFSKARVQSFKKRKNQRRIRINCERTPCLMQ